ncbi:MAG TPA: sulfotransferase family protein, partial [Pseudonocardiaceae bacterium]|nr:sulfotransferase family protein [Pseudonocardiaceae bacterium]
MTDTSNLLFLWGPPRSLSTAFLRMMIERGDHEVVHEPFSSIVVQGHVTIGGRVATTHDELVTLLADRAGDRRVFVKETTEYDYLNTGGERVTEIGLHTFIIRHPRSVIPSHYARNPKVTCAEVGYEHQVDVARRAWSGKDAGPIVVEAEDLVANPAGAVAAYCDHVGIPFLESALRWTPRDDDTWSRTREWHRDAAASSGFDRPAHAYERTVD